MGRVGQLGWQVQQSRVAWAACTEEGILGRGHRAWHLLCQSPQGAAGTVRALAQEALKMRYSVLLSINPSMAADGIQGDQGHEMLAQDHGSTEPLLFPIPMGKKFMQTAARQPARPHPTKTYF